jgi:crotonobetainyl-CoA:carnitine CoA-transferase CaiB-like acyl-CoA transferase
MIDFLPFSGIKVFDITQGVAGPHATMLLAQYGADVVKIEPLEGDWARTMGRTYGDLGAYSIAFSRGKRSISLDLKTDEGRRIAKQMASEAHVIVENFRSGVMGKLGLGYEDVCRDNPEVVYLSITGFGQKGPKSRLPVTDSAIQAFSGWMTPPRNSHTPPVRSEMLPIDVMTGLYAFQALAPAIFRQFRYGKGAYIDCSMMQSAAAFQAGKMIENFLEEGKPQGLYVPSGVLQTEDGFVCISGMREEHWRAICKVIGLPALADDARFNSRLKRVDNELELMPILQAEFNKWKADALSQALSDAGIINCRVNSYSDFIADPHVAEAEALAWVEHPDLRLLPLANIPGAPPPVTGALAAECPHVGQHSIEILRELGFDKAAIDAAVSGGAVGIYSGAKYGT